MSLVLRFALLSLAVTIALGVVLTESSARATARRSLDSARDSVVLVSRLGIQPQLTPSGLAHGLGPAEVANLDRVLRSDEGSASIARIKIWNRSDHVVYSDDTSLIGRRFEADDQLLAALDGHVESEISTLGRAENASERHFGKLFEVYVPITFAGASRPAGAFELYLPYAPIGREITKDNRQRNLLFAGGLALLWLVLLPVVWQASRRLRRTSAANHHQAMHDALTDLPNRTMLRAQLVTAIEAATSASTGVGVLVLDVDRFKEVNDTLGYQNGDLLLRAIGDRVVATLPARATVARLGSDEFAVVVPAMAHPARALAVARDLVTALETPFTVDDLSVEVEATIGVSIFPEHGTDAETLLRRADVAMQWAKESHVAVELYAIEHDTYSRRRLGLVADLRRALDGDELVLHYQPQVSLETGRATGVEALLRWNHPEHGLLPPDEFIPLAERSGLIHPLTEHVLERACTDCRVWRSRGVELSVAVNLSARNLIETDLLERVRGLLVRHDLPPSALVLEITESTIMADPVAVTEVVRRLRAEGLAVSIDDFGTGYSSLAHLRHLPVSEIKIDKSFVFGMVDDPADATIVRSAIELAHNLHLTAVAEGVETEIARDALAALGCDVAQGYFYALPMPAAELMEWVRRHHASAADASRLGRR
ncbi:MAG TPA: bifunctional diguanylate cyclase/phosphodiesterase [Acidimicrobiia bacterium]|jgi:diguanylate cyclase (GGDEF)-like protein